MTVKDLIGDIHRKLQVKLKRDLSYSDVAGIMGIKFRTYQNWRDGTSSPKSVIHFFDLISKLDDEEILNIIRNWREDKSSLKE